MARRRDRFVDRILIVSDDQQRIEDARVQVREYVAKTEKSIDTWSVNGIQACLELLDKYINVIVLSYAGFSKEQVIPVVRQLRTKYFGKVILINDDKTVDPCEWGRLHKVDLHLPSPAGLVGYLDRVLADSGKRGKTAVVFAGGGILGGFIEAGSWKALYDFGIRDFDIFVGLSAGAVIAACAANGSTPEEVIEHKEFTLADFYNPNLRDIAAKVLGFPWNLARSLAEYLVLPNRDIFFTLSSLFVPALLDGRRIAQKLGKIFEERGGTNSFREMREKRGKELFIMAVDLDSMEERVFGEEGDMDVSITEAVAASTALPIFYRPVGLGGRDYIDGGVARTATVHVAIHHGADVVVCVNPLVPYTGGNAGFIKSLGIVGIAEQCYRTMLQHRLHRSIRSYRERYPHVTFILVEPDPKDITMFHNPLNASSSLMALAALHGFTSTKRAIESQYDYIERVFHYHRRPISRRRVDREFDVLVEADFSEAAIEEVLSHQHSFE